MGSDIGERVYFEDAQIRIQSRYRHTNSLMRKVRFRIVHEIIHRAISTLSSPLGNHPCQNETVKQSFMVS